MNFQKLLLLAAGALIVGAVALASNDGQDKGKEKPGSRPANEAKVEVPFYGNENCPYTNKPVDRSKSVTVGGQVVYVCCNNCLKKAKDDKEVATKAYPADKVVDLKNTVCPLMEEKIGDSKEKATVMGRTIHLCCDDCAEDAKKFPVATLALAMNPKLKDVGNKKCPVSNEAVSGKDVAIYEGKLVKLCCGDCVEGFKKDPAKMLEAAEKSVQKKGEKK